MARRQPTEREIVDQVRAAVGARVAVDARETGAIRRFLAELDRLRAPFDDAADPVHVTASAIVVGVRGVVLLRHKRLGIWLQPGGHVEPGELPWDAALRESREETGLPLAHASGADPPSLVHVDVHLAAHGHTHLDLRYLLIGGDADPAPAEGESPDVRWFSWDEALAIADPGLAGGLAALRVGRGA